jgi:hypothetical protein
MATSSTLVALVACAVVTPTVIYAWIVRNHRHKHHLATATTRGGIEAQPPQRHQRQAWTDETTPASPTDHQPTPKPPGPAAGHNQPPAAHSYRPGVNSSTTQWDRADTDTRPGRAQIADTTAQKAHQDH